MAVSDVFWFATKSVECALWILGAREEFDVSKNIFGLNELCLDLLGQYCF